MRAMSNVPALHMRTDVASAQAIGRMAVPRPTTVFERILLILIIVALPLQDLLPVIAGFTSMFLIFAFLGLFVVFFRVRSLEHICAHPLFLTTYGFLILIGLMEALHPHPSYGEIFRLGQTLSGAMFLACLCRDRKALQAGIYGYLMMAVWWSGYLFLTSYGVLAGSSGGDFEAATQLRAEIGNESLGALSPNTLGFFAAQGTALSLVMALTAKSTWQRIFFYGPLLLCGLATFLTMSRGAVAIAVVCCASVLFASGFKYVNALFGVVALILVILLLVPDVVFARMVFGPIAEAGVMEGRTRVYTAGLEHLSEYVWTGVGNGNFWGYWGFNSSFVSAKGNVTGAHNSFIAVTVYWGLPGLIALLALIFQAYRCVPRYAERDPLALCVLAISVSMLFFLMVMHVLSAKQFALGLGLLVGAHRWIWPRITAPSPIHLRGHLPVGRRDVRNFGH